jgi:hypothetical protein
MQSQVVNDADGKPAPRKYMSTFQTLRLIRREEGLRAMWKGFAPNVGRRACRTACESVLTREARSAFAWESVEVSLCWYVRLLFVERRGSGKRRSDVRVDCARGHR